MRKRSRVVQPCGKNITRSRHANTVDRRTGGLKISDPRMLERMKHVGGTEARFGAEEDAVGWVLDP